MCVFFCSLVQDQVARGVQVVPGLQHDLPGVQLGSCGLMIYDLLLILLSPQTYYIVICNHVSDLVLRGSRFSLRTRLLRDDLLRHSLDRLVRLLFVATFTASSFATWAALASCSAFSVAFAAAAALAWRLFLASTPRPSRLCGGGSPFRARSSTSTYIHIHINACIFTHSLTGAEQPRVGCIGGDDVR